MHATHFAVMLLTLPCGQPHDWTGDGSLGWPGEQEYRKAVDSHDPAEARRRFAQAAKEFEKAHPFLDAPESLMYGNALFAAGRPVDAIVAYRFGLFYAPNDLRLRRQLARVRESLASGSMPITFAEPWPSRRQLSIVAAFLILLAAASYAIGQRTGRRRAGLIGVLLVCVLLSETITLMNGQRDELRDFETHIVRRETPLRIGNGPHYDALANAAPLRAGQEVRVRGSRGDWVRVECPDGTMGWLPNQSLVR